MAYTPEQRKAYYKAYRAANKERRATNDKAYCATEHGTQRRAPAFKAWYGANRDRKAAALKAWKADNPEKVRACDAHRRALKSRACPPGLTERPSKQSTAAAQMTTTWTTSTH
jgi:hypothetical protein